MELSTFLNSEGWESNEEFGVEIEYEGKTSFASITEYRQNGCCVFLVTLNGGKELLLLSSNHATEGSVKWFPVDIANLELAAVLGEGIRGCER